MNIIETLIEKYAWVIDAYVWFNVIGVIVGLIVFAVSIVITLKIYRKIKEKHEINSVHFKERRRKFEQEHEEIKNRIRQKRWDFDNK